MVTERKELKAFGTSPISVSGEPPITRNGVFGSTKSGLLVLSDDTDVLQSGTNWSQGWYAATENGRRVPRLEEWQGVQMVHNQFLKYALSTIPGWHQSTEYKKGYMCKQTVGGNSCLCISNDNDPQTGNDPTTTAGATHWLIYDFTKLLNTGLTNLTADGEAKFASETVKTAADRSLSNLTNAGDGVIDGRVNTLVSVEATTRGNADNALRDLIYKGILQFDITRTYALNDVVLINEVAYISLQDSNTGNDPTATPTAWKEWFDYFMDLPEWKPTLEFNTDMLCRVGHIIYYSLIDNNVGNDPTTSPTAWGDVFSNVISLLNAEIATREQGEQTLQTNIDNEANRATNAETVLDGLISDEVSNRTIADTDITTQLTDFKTYQTGINNIKANSDSVTTSNTKPGDQIMANDVLNILNFKIEAEDPTPENVTGIITFTNGFTLKYLTDTFAVFNSEDIAQNEIWNTTLGWLTDGAALGYEVAAVSGIDTEDFWKSVTAELPDATYIMNVVDTVLKRQFVPTNNYAVGNVTLTPDTDENELNLQSIHVPVDVHSADEVITKNIKIKFGAGLVLTAGSEENEFILDLAP